MIRILLPLFMLLTFTATAQTLKVLRLNRDAFRHPKVEGFSYLHDDANTSGHEWIGDVRVAFDSIYPTTLKEIYNLFATKANKISGNAFRVINSDIHKQGKDKFIELGIYYLNYENQTENLNLFENNLIYLFGFIGHHQDIEGYNLEINGKKILLEELTVKTIRPNVNEILQIKLMNGLKTDEIQVKIETKMLPKYFKFEIFKGAFSRGLISEHEWSYGEFLARIFKKQTISL